MKKPFKDTKFGRTLKTVGVIVLTGIGDVIPALEPIKKLIIKRPEGTESTKGEDITRIVTALVVLLALVGVWVGKVSPETLTAILNHLKQ